LGSEKTSPLKEISPRDSLEQKRKDLKDQLGQDRVHKECTCHHSWSVMCFLHSHLVYSSLSIVLLSLGQGRVSIAVWWCSHSLSWGGRLMPIGTLEGHVTWLSTVKACLNCFHWCCTIDTWGPLRTLIPSVWSLVTIGTRSHLVLRGHKSLSSRLGSLLKVLLHRV
jgi:hypothetical protein